MSFRKNMWLGWTLTRGRVETPCRPYKEEKKKIEKKRKKIEKRKKRKIFLFVFFYSRNTITLQKMHQIKY